MAVKVIKAKKEVQPQSATREQNSERPLRVACYCRVSTDSEEQETSYEAQVR